MKKIYAAIFTFRKYQFFAFALGTFLGLLGNSNLIAQTTITFPSTTSWTCPIGVNSIIVECWGGGGAGGGATGNPAAGGGGGGGSYVKNTAISVIPGNNYTINVGAAVTGNQNPGANGNPSWFGSVSTIYATGGNGGALAASNSQTAAGATAVTTGNIGTSSYYGGAGGTGAANGVSGGGGGSSAGTGSNGNNASGVTGGAAPAGGFAGVSGSPTSADGADNTNIGGGGAGARAGSNTDRNGGNGGPGQVKITYTQLTYKSQIISVSAASTAPWCPGEVRNVQVTIKNTGTATWTNANPDINIGVKWNTNGANWLDYHIRTDAGNLAPGATQTYTLPLTASNNTGGGYTTPLAAGTNNLIFDVVYEGISWFGDNGGGVGPGNSKLTTPNVTIRSAATVDAGATLIDICQGSTSAALGGSAGGSATTGIWTDGGVGGVFTPNANTLNATWTPPAAYVGTATLTLTNSDGCGSASDSKTQLVKPSPTGSLTASATTICAGTAVTFTATPGFALYKFYVNATAYSPTPTNTFSLSTLANGDVVKVEVFQNNCASFFNPITMTVNPLPIASLTADKTSICPGDAITFTAGGGNNYTFKVNGVAQQSGASNVYANSSLNNGDNVTVDVKNTATGCVATSSQISITVKPVPSGTLTPNPANATICAGQPITFNATSGFSIYEFFVNGTSVQGPSGTNTYTTSSINNGQVVTVTATNGVGCSTTFTGVPVTVNALPVGSVTATENSGTPDNNVICAGDNITFTFAPAGLGNYKFYLNGTGAALYNGPSNVYSTTALNNTDFITVVVTNGNSCQKTFTSPAITVNAIPAGTLTASANPICAGDDVTFTATPIAGATYHFKVGGVSKQNSGANTYTTNVLANGNSVSVDVTNTNGCVKTFNTITMVVNALPTGTLSIAETSGTANDDGIICAGASVTFTAPAGFTNYDFQVNSSSVQSGGTRTFTTTVLANNDDVSVIVKNGNNCVATLNTFTIIVNPLPTVQPITGTPSVCVGSVTALDDATPGGVWSSGNTSIATIDASGNVTGVASGSVVISYSVTNGSNCNTTVTATITVNPVPSVAAIGGTPSVCVGNNRQLTDGTSGGIWSSSNTSVATVSTTGLVSGLTAGTTTISYAVGNGFGCITTRTLSFTVNALPVVAGITGTLSVCAGKTTTLSDATTGGTWSSANTAIATVGSSTGIVTGVAAGTVTIRYTVTNGNGCSATVTADVDVYALPVPTLTGPNPICPLATSTYTTEPGQSNYTWTVTGGTVTAGGGTTNNTITIYWDLPGIRTVYVNYTNANGCSAATSTTVTTATGTIPSLTGTTPVCLNSNGSYTTNAGQTNYTWSVTGGTITAGGTSADAGATVNWTSPGTQNISVNFTDGSGCTAASPTVFPVTVHSLPTATITGTTSVCNNATQPQITFTGASGLAPYTFTYSINGGANQNITTVSGNSISISVPTGTVGSFTYDLTGVSDNHSCSQSQTGSATVTVTPLPTAIISGTTAVCKNNASPDITFTGAAGTAPFTFTYTINGGAPQTVTTTSGNSVTVAVPTGTTGIFNYNLVSVKDANICTQPQTGTATVAVNPLPTATISGTIAACQGSPLPNITFTGANGTAPYLFTFQINGGANQTVSSVGNTATVPAPTATPGSFVYTLLSVQDGSSTTCSQAQAGTATVTIDATSVGGSVSANATVCSGTNTGTLTLTGNTGSVVRWELSINGGTTWSTVANTTTSLTYNNLTTNTLYRAVVQNGSCTIANSSIVTITVNPVTVGGTVGASASVCSGINSGTLNLTGQAGNVVRWESSTNGGGTWTAISNTTTTQAYTNLTQTTMYRAVVQSGVCGVVNSAAATITVNPLPTAAITGTIGVCQNAPSPTVTFTGAGGTAPYTFTYKINAGGNLTVVSTGNTATVAAPTGTVGTFTYSLVSVKDASAAICSQTQSGSAVVTVNAPPPPPPVSPVTATICQGAILPLISGNTVNNTFNATFNSGNIAIAIPDKSDIGIANTISVSGIPLGAVVNSISINFTITHPNDGDLVMNLKAANNGVLNIARQIGGSGNNFNNTTVTSSTGYNNISTQSAPYSGTYAPHARNNTQGANIVPNNLSTTNNFSSLFGTPNGNWIFSVKDVVNNNTGILNNWSITINYTVTSVNSLTWSPLTDLYSDAGATVPYAGQNLTAVYAQPATAGTKVYTATATNAAGCTNSSNITITVNPTPAVSISADYCSVPGKVRLTAMSSPAGATYLWSTGQSGSSIDVDIAGDYDVVARLASGCSATATISVAQELVVNGDFEGGDGVGFTTAYTSRTGSFYTGTPASGLWPEGDYAVDVSAFSPSNGTGYHPLFHGRDHTTGNGKFMMVNGSLSLRTIWVETVPVLPNTTYYFSAWGMNLNPGFPAQLQFAVNGVQRGSIADLNTAPKPTTEGQVNLANWARFYGTWTSGPTTTTAVINIVNLNTIAGGNDFGLDDISFATLSTFVSLESAAGSDAQTICVNDPLTDIVYNVGNGNPSGPTVSALPAGVTSAWTGTKIIISGTPTTPGTYPYTIATTGPCNPQTVTGNITVQGQKVSLTSGSASPSICINTPVNIGYTLSGTASSAVVTGLPAGITSTVSGNSITISGMTSVAGIYPYKIVSSGTCSADSLAGTITVKSQTITLTSVVGTDAQAVCLNSSITNIQYTLGGSATGATVSGLPAGVTANVSGGFVIITGSPSAYGSFTYTINLTGTCGPASATGTIATLNVWTGATDTDWNTASNWTGNQVPNTGCAEVYIPNTSNKPVLNGAPIATITNLHILSGALVTINNTGMMQIGGDIFNAGTFDVTDGGIEFNRVGTSQTIPANVFYTNKIKDLIISNNVSLNGVDSITGSLSFGSSGKTFTTNGNLTIKSTISSTGAVGKIMNGNQISGDVSVERYIATGVGSAPNHGKSWQLLAVPVTGATLYSGQTIKQSWMEGATVSNIGSPGAGSAGNPVGGYGTLITSDRSNAVALGFDSYTSPGPSIKYYNPLTNGYTGPASTATALYNPKGYFVFVRGDRSVTVFNQPANPTILRSKGRLFDETYLPPSTSLILNGFESVGNPYASPLDFRLVSKTTLASAYQVWDPRLGGAYNYGAFQTFTADLNGNYKVTPGGGSYGTPGSVHNFIQSGQAFFVQTTIGNTGSISFTEAAKGDTASSLFTTPARGPKMELSLRTSLYAVTGGQELLDGVLNEFDGSYSNGLDGMDARKNTNTGENLSIKTGGRLLAVERRQPVSGQDTIFLNLTGVRSQAYRFGFEAANLNINGLQGFLEDTYLHTRTAINMNGNTLVDVAVTNIPASYAANRFQIVFAPAVALPVTFTEIKAYRQAANINIDWKVENEINIKNYTVEKSADGIHFSTLATTAATGNGGSSVSYQATDGYPVNGYNYYRIRSNDVDGKTQTTRVVKVLMGSGKQGIQIYPNPITDGMIHLQFMNEPEGKYAIRLLNKLGQVILSRQLTRMDGSSTELIKWDFNLAHGMYQLEITRPDGSVKNLNVMY